MIIITYLKQNKSYITLRKGNSNSLPQNIICDKGNITVFDPGFKLSWEVQTNYQMKGEPEL